MKEEIAKRWIEDLRGNPPQIKGRLVSEEGHCCLGRLCVVLDLKPEKSGSHIVLDRCIGVLPNSVMVKVGMHSCTGALPDSGSLADMNDAGYTFAEIANVIEANWQAL